MKLTINSNQWDISVKYENDHENNDEGRMREKGETSDEVSDRSQLFRRR